MQEWRTDSTPRWYRQYLTSTSSTERLSGSEAPTSGVQVPVYVQSKNSLPYCAVRSRRGIRIKTTKCTYRLVQVESYKKSRVGSPRRSREIDVEFLRTCSKSPCQLVNERCFFGRFCWWNIWTLRNPEFPREKKKKKHPSLTGRQGLTEHVCQNSASISYKNDVKKMGFCAENMWISRGCP